MQIQKLNKVNEDLRKTIEDNEKEYKSTQGYSYQEHFKKMFLKFVENLGHKLAFLKKFQ